MDDNSRKKLLALAKQQLGLPASSNDDVVPDIYVKELQHHLSMCPLDDNFRVTLQPKYGYGTITCLEQGCDGLSIALGVRLNAQDGGAKDGLGSLAKYRAHIEDHPIHRKSRLARVKRQNSTKNENNDKASTHRCLVKQEGSGLLRLLDTPPITSSVPSSAYIHNNAKLPVTTSNSTPVARRASSLVRIKPEPVDSALPPRKRTSDSAFNPLAKAEVKDDPFKAPAFSSKRLKMDASHKTPLAQVNYNALVPSKSEPTTTSAVSALTSPPSMSVAFVTGRAPHPEPSAVEDIRTKIEDTQAHISYLQEHINRILHKPKKIKADLTRLEKLLSQMEECKRRKSEYTASIPNLSPFKRRPKNMSLSVIPPLNLGSGLAAAGTSTIVPPPAFQNSAYPLVRFRGASPLEVVRRRTEARQLQAQPVASGSNVRLPSATPSSAPSSVKKEEQLPLSPFAMRMGIRGRLSVPNTPKPLVKPEPTPIPFLAEKVAPPPRPNYVMSGAFGDPLDGYDSDEGGMAVDPAVYANVVNRIGINIPLPLEGAARFDQDGDFYGRGKDIFLGPQAKADDIDKFLIEAGNAEAFDGNASVDKALKRLQLRMQYDLIPGMEVALMPHQTIGVAWMVDKEASTLQGGCLGDDMGLGKTVQMIAIIVKNKSLDLQCKTNLIIAPTALLDQWKIEIEMKTNCGLKCLIYHGTSKPKRKQDLLNYDVVLTTYMTMSLEWPDIEGEIKKEEKARKKKKKKDDFIASDDDGEFNDKEARSKKRQKDAGLLFQVDFFRVILDEAQAIRNRRTRTSRAVTDLRAVYRWCLTGTPIINSLGDVYGYLRFLKIRPWYDFAKFQSQVGGLEKKNPALAVSRLQAIIQTFLLRRMKDSMLDGKHLIELPEKKVELVKLEFTQEERDIYSMVEARNQATFNRFLRAGTVLKNYHQVLVLLLRLRQLCSHPSLIQEDGVAFISPEEIHKNDSKSPEITTELSRARRLVSPEFVTRMKEKFKASALARIQAEKESVDAAVDDEECPICFDPFTSAVITPCAHVFCRDCLVEVIHNAVPVEPNTDDPTKYKANERPCPSCRDPICEEKLFEREAFEPSDEDLLPPGQKPKDEDVEKLNFDAHEVIDVDGIDSSSDRKGKEKAKSRIRRPKRVPRSHRIISSDDVIMLDTDIDTVLEKEEDGEEDDMSDFIVDSDEDEEEKDERRALKKKRLGKRRAHVVLDSDEEIEDTPEEREVLFGRRKVPIAPEAIKLMPRFLPSTKMKYMMERILQLTKGRPDEKILVVSQWTACLSLVSDYLLQAGIIHVKYQGDMNRTKRDQAVRVFMSKDKAHVMLMSLKCGGVGLNLTRANNVISLDLGWSQAIESQAFDRVHRLGQTRSVDVQRLVISDTVEDRVLAMQLRKQTLADGSLGEGTGKKIGRLTVRELANLFGLDHRGRLLTKD